MAILQALLALISKSAGKILNAIFGWAVHALFGRTSSGQQTFLSGLVAAAIAWPLLLVGLIKPKIAAFLLAFVPIPHWVPAGAVRLVWLGLALLVPLALGLAMTAKSPTSARERAVTRFLRGFPITVGLAAAFVILFVSVPIMRLVAVLRRQKSADVPLMTDVDAYHRAAAACVEALNRHGFALRRASPGWWVSAPTRILGWFGGDAFRQFVPDRLEHFQSPRLAVSFYSSGVLLRGAGQQVTWGHGLIAEVAARGDGYQTTDSAAQKVERQIQSVWRAYQSDPDAHEGAPRLLERVGEIARELGKLDVEFEEWQVLYRQLLQLERGVRGEAQLLEAWTSNEKQEGENMATNGMGRHENGGVPPGNPRATSATGRVPHPPPGPSLSTERPVAALSIGALLEQISAQVALLAKKEIALAKTELSADLRNEAAMAGGLGVAAIAGLATLNLLLVTAVLALAQMMPPWLAGLVVSAAILAAAVAAALWGWNKRVRVPLARTRQTFKDNGQWAKERLA